MMETVEKIWIVEGSTGEYSDRTDWKVCAFRDEAKAKSLVAELTILASATEAHCDVNGNRYTFEDTKPGMVWKAKDPSAQLDYTGSSYYVYEIGLHP